MPKTPPKDRPNEPEKLPDNITDCHTMIRELFARIAELEKQVRRRNRIIHGRKSAKVSSESLTGTGKVIYDNLTNELEQERRRLQLAPESKFHGGGGRNIPEGLEPKPVPHTLEDAVRACPGCGNLRQIFGFNPSYQLDIVKATFELLKHIEYKYHCPDCEGHLITAHKPYQPIDKGYPAPGLIAYVGTAKYDWHQPLYRQERIFRAQNVPIPRSSMVRWLKGGAAILHLIVERMHQLLLQSRLVQSDATTMPVIIKGRGKVHLGYNWLYRNEKYIVIDFTEKHDSAQPKRMLPDFKNILLTDGHSVYNKVVEDGATRAGCSAHAFRYLEDARKEDPERVDCGLAIMKSLFDVERLALNLPEDERQRVREQFTQPRLTALRAWIDETAPFAFPKTALGEAITYLQNQWEPLCYYAKTGFVPSHNNASENGLRPSKLGKNNWLFAGSVEGGRTAATWMSIVQTCRHLNIDPFEYIKDVLTRMPSASTADIDQFLPDRWKELRKE